MNAHARTIGCVTGYAFRSYRCGLVVVGTSGAASAACWLLKRLVARRRPPLGVQETIETDYSFPSGHVTGTTALVGMAVAVAVLAVLLVVAVSTGRLYLGVHWLTDVVAGVLLGCAAAVAGGVLLQQQVAAAVDKRSSTAPDHCEAVA